jgi:DNA-directed RNA polymerase subunit RPC12/RpoP
LLDFSFWEAYDQLDMKAARLLDSVGSSKCHNAKLLLVLSRRGGYVAKDCLVCGKSNPVRLLDLPDLQCEHCNGQLAARVVDKNYWYKCGQCGHEWEFASVLPEWSDLFPYWGLAAPGDPSYSG